MVTSHDASWPLVKNLQTPRNICGVGSISRSFLRTQNGEILEGLYNEDPQRIFSIIYKSKNNTNIHKKSVDRRAALARLFVSMRRNSRDVKDIGVAG